MPILPNAATLAARSHDQADRDTRDHSLRLGASGRGTVSRPVTLGGLACLPLNELGRHELSTMPNSNRSG
jgi:hypothetical protein